MKISKRLFEDIFLLLFCLWLAGTVPILGYSALLVLLIYWLKRTSKNKK